MTGLSICINTPTMINDTATQQQRRATQRRPTSVAMIIPKYRGMYIRADAEEGGSPAAHSVICAAHTHNDTDVLARDADSARHVAEATLQQRTVLVALLTTTYITHAHESIIQPNDAKLTATLCNAVKDADPSLIFL